MAKIGVISDIHSNMESLTEALKILENQCVDEIVCLGDIVGYGPEPLQCLKMVRSVCSLVIQGNHDAAVSDDGEYARMNNMARVGIDYARMQLDSEAKEYLSSLQRGSMLSDQRTTLAHGSLTGDHFDYIQSTRSAVENVLLMKTPYLLVGHSHEAFIREFELSEEGKKATLSFQECREKAAVTYTMDEGKKYIINPGSVGQPRDIPLGGLCIMESDSNDVTFIRYPYDINLTIDKVIKAGLPDYAWQRLVKGC